MSDHLFHPRRIRLRPRRIPEIYLKKTRSVRLPQKRTGRRQMKINPRFIDFANSRFVNCRNSKPSVFICRFQLKRISRLQPKPPGESRSEQNSLRIVSKMLKTSKKNLIAERADPKMRIEIDAKSVNRRFIDSCPHPGRSAHNRRNTRNIFKFENRLLHFSRLGDSGQILTRRPVSDPKRGIAFLRQLHRTKSILKLIADLNRSTRPKYRANVKLLKPSLLRLRQNKKPDAGRNPADD